MSGGEWDEDMPGSWKQAVRELPAYAAPDGFAERVLAKFEAEQAAARRAPSRWRWWPSWAPSGGQGPAWGWALAATCAVLFALGLPVGLRSSESGPLATAGSTGPRGIHLVVRTSEGAGPHALGAADAVRIFEETVRARGGRIERRDGELLALLPHAGLLDFIRSLAERGDFEVRQGPNKTDDPSAWPDHLWIRFELP